MKFQSEKVVIPRVIATVRSALAQEIMRREKKTKEVFAQEEHTVVTDHTKENTDHQKDVSSSSSAVVDSPNKKPIEVIFWVVFLFLLGIIAGVLFLV